MEVRDVFANAVFVVHPTARAPRRAFVAVSHDDSDGHFDRSATQDLARTLGVFFYLGPQGVHVLELLDRTNEVDEGDAKLFPIKVAIEVEEVHFEGGGTIDRRTSAEIRYSGR